MHLNKVSIRSSDFPVKNVYPFHLDIFNKTDEICFESPVTFFIGENGTGKSTLLKAIAKKCAIHIWRDDERSTYYYNKYAEEMYRYIDIKWEKDRVPGSFFASEIFQYFAEFLDEWAKADPAVFEDFGGDSLLTRSHGQRHLTYFKSRYMKRGLYLLDEPENALSPKRQIDFIQVLKETVKTGNVQYIIATHSPIILAYPDAQIFSFDLCPIRKIKYEDTDYYSIYKSFLNDRESYLNGYHFEK
jgi:predicted ATPase